MSERRPGARLMSWGAMLKGGPGRIRRNDDSSTAIKKLLEGDERRDAVFACLKDGPSLRRLEAFGARLRFKTGRDTYDLINEAVMRILGGERQTWPSDIPAIIFIGGVMRSIASEWYDHRRSLSEKAMELARWHQISDRPDIDNALLKSHGDVDDFKASYRRVVESFEDDPVGLQVFMGICEGKDGEELRRECGLSPLEYQSKRKLVRRRIEQHRPRE